MNIDSMGFLYLSILLDSMTITPKTLAFLKALKTNNNRDWFSNHKTEFLEHQMGITLFYETLYQKLNQHDTVDAFKVYRIYRDVRFSKNKAPYKSHFAGSFHRKKPELRGGYYLQLAPDDESFLAGGFWNPNKEDLLRIRKELESDASAFRNFLKSPEFVAHFGGTLEGEELKTAPRGFPKTHPNIDLIRKKGFIAVKKFTDKDVLSPEFSKNVDLSFQALRPFFDVMSDILTTNLNGESLL